MLRVKASHHLTQLLIDDCLQTARVRDDAQRAAAPEARPGSSFANRQKALVIQSLLLSSRVDAPTHRRWA